ncbi:MAG: hypothetical protein HYU36_15295 [Planctomycetes bacterium]|nr:hypothetical protein [Planctomycetota bacterium]
MRERMLAVIQGREPDRVPFVQYDGLAGPNKEIWSLIGRDRMGLLRWSAVHRFEYPNCRFESVDFERAGRRARRTTLHTPAGSLTEERVFEPGLGTSAIRKHYVVEPADYRVLKAYLEDIRVCEDVEHFLRDQRELGEDGVPLVAVCRTPYQQLWVQWVCLEDLSLHLADCPETVEECMSALRRIQRQIFEIVRGSPVPFVDFPDNITAPAIGEKYFRKYCVPLYDELAGMLAQKRIPVFVHMDGSLKPLWRAIGESRVQGIDSLSPPPDNDTSPREALATWPGMRLFVNFPSSVHLAGPERIFQRTQELLAEAGGSGRLQIQISENVPPGSWRKSFPEIVRAIDAFGRFKQGSLNSQEKAVPAARHPRVELALDAIHHRPTKGIPTWLIHVMEHAFIERLAGARPGDYFRDPARTYLAFQHAAGTCLLDQFIPDNPLSMGCRGYENRAKGTTTGASEIVCDGIRVECPEAVVEHLERFIFPSLRKAIGEFDEDARVGEILKREREVQEVLGPEILKSGYGFVRFPGFRYGLYGYVHYFEAYALYPEVMEKDFSLQADLALLNNRAAARAYREGNLPPIYRLDHDMADSRGTFVRVETLDRLWFPHFARCLEPMLRTDVKMLWHCDGNLMAMAPRLLEVGIRGFQGFQYEHGMDYEKICAMKTRDGDSLTIIAGVSVSGTLCHGTPDDVRREMAWLVEKGPRVGLFLAGSSSITPGTPWANIKTFVEGLNYYREHGRVSA